MSSYEIEELIKHWEFERISGEQVIGQLLVHLQKLIQKVDGLERDLLNLKGASGNEIASPESAEKWVRP